MSDILMPLSPCPLAVPAASLKFITRTFGGKPLTVLTGHEDFDLVFIVNQVAEIGHIASPSAARAMTMEATEGYGFLQLGEVLKLIQNPEQIGPWGLEQAKGDTWLASSAAAYRMLLRLDAPLGEFFKQWLIDCLLPEVREMADAIETTDVYPEEVDQLKAALRLLERRLNASTDRVRRLERMLQTCDRNLVKATMELISLRRGDARAGKPCNAPASFLERVQAEFNELSDRWWRYQRRDETELYRAERDERWYREYFASEKQKPRL